MIEMTGKLALRNMKRSMSDYAVYFVTLIIGIAVFYVFNAVTDQKVVLSIYKSEYDIIDLLRNVMSGASVVVSVVLAFLVVYASNFLMKRRKKEFGIYLLLGMGKKKIAGILMTETVIIGVISLVAGLGAGIVLSQGMSILVARLFEADMSKFSFEVSAGAVGKTILYFLVVYAVVLLLDLFVVGKSRLIRLLSAERRSEKNTARNPVVCAVVFVAAAAVLGHAYYQMTANAQNLDSEVEVLIQIAKGIISTFVIFWSLSGLLIFLAKLRKKSYLKGINTFTMKEISSRINTNVFAGGVICLLLFLTICIFSTAFSINQSLNANMKELAPADVCMEKYMYADDELTQKNDQSSFRELFEKKNVDSAMFRDSVEACLYFYEEPDPARRENPQLYFDDDIGANIFTSGRVMSLSDYNKVAGIYRREPLSLKDGEYAVVANYEYTAAQWDEKMAAGRTVQLAGKEYRPASDRHTDGFLYMAQNPAESGFTVVPDEAVADGNLKQLIRIYIANYNKDFEKGTGYTDKRLNSEKFAHKLGDSVSVTTRTSLLQRSIGLASMIVFLGLYLGIVFLIASSALLALKELSQAADNQEKYRILRRIGVSEKMIHRSLFRQNAIFFGAPLLLAVIHSVFGIQVSVYIIEVFGKTGLVSAIVMTAVFLCVIYLIYFAVTYLCSRRIIQD